MQEHVPFTTHKVLLEESGGKTYIL